MPKARKMLNFDLDTNRYKEVTNSKSASSAYDTIRRFMEDNDFVHRQGSCYTSKFPLSNADAYSLVYKMSVEIPWLSECIRECDITDVTRRTPVVGVIKEAAQTAREKAQADLDIKIELDDYEIDR